VRVSRWLRVPVCVHVRACERIEKNGAKIYGKSITKRMYDDVVVKFHSQDMQNAK